MNTTLSALRREYESNPCCFPSTYFLTPAGQAGLISVRARSNVTAPSHTIFLSFVSSRSFERVFLVVVQKWHSNGCVFEP